MSQQVFKDRELENALLVYGGNSKALTLILRYKRDLPTLKKSKTVDPHIVSYYEEKLKDIPESLGTCSCCGFKGLVNVKRVGNMILGPECSREGHPIGQCKREKA